MKRILLSLLTLSIFAILCAYRFKNYPDFDQRNKVQIENVKKLREEQNFSNLSRSSRFQKFFFPGMKAAQLSFIWLETLSGLHATASAEEDFGWLFSKLYTLANDSHGGAMQRVLLLAPYFYVIGKDSIGATLLMNKTIERRPDLWLSWFWGAFHALENLKDKQLSSDLYAHASALPEAPAYLPLLVLKLKFDGGDPMSDPLKRKLIIEQMPEHLVTALRQIRPEYFDN